LRLGTRQHFRCVDVLPPGVAYIHGTRFFSGGHQSNSICQAAISVLLCLLEIFKDFGWTNEESSINRVVIPQIFSDGDDLAPARFDLHRIIQIEN